MVQAALKLVLEPIFEADMLDCSFGFRPRRAAHDGLQVVVDEAWKGRRWVVETDISDCLDPASHCPLGAGERVQQPAVGLGDLDTQAFPAPGADVDGA